MSAEGSCRTHLTLLVSIGALNCQLISLSSDADISAETFTFLGAFL